MKRVVVSCAPPGTGSGSNLGMNTVDLAIHNIAHEAGVLGQVALRRPWPPYRPGASSIGGDRWPMRFVYGPERLIGGCDESTGDAAAVLFWGDFQHGRDYLLMSASRRQAIERSLGREIGREAALQWARQYFMLDEIEIDPEVTSVSMYGGTLFQNAALDYRDRNYVESLARLYRAARFARARDPYSAEKIAFIRGDFSHTYLGVDCAMLNRRDEFAALERWSPPEIAAYDGAVGVFLGRSSTAFPLAGAARFIRRVAGELASPVSWVPWSLHSGALMSSRLRRLRWLVPRIRTDRERSHWAAGDILHALSQVRLMITDTYHVAVNSIALGVPCVMLHEPSPAESRNANIGHRHAGRDKRVLLYLCNDLADLLVPTTDLVHRRTSDLRASNVVDLVRQDGAVAAAYSGLVVRASKDRRNLVTLLRELAG